MWGVISLVLSMLSITFVLEEFREMGYEKQVLIIYMLMIVLLIIGFVIWTIKQLKGIKKL